MRISPANIVRVVDMATDSQREEGMLWYFDAYSFAQELNPANPDQAAGVIAALSPKMPWTRNMVLALHAYKNGEASGTMARDVKFANRILGGEDWRDVLNGNKTRNFAALISNPLDATSVCVDRHAFDVAIGRKTDEKFRKALERKGVYDKFVMAYQTAAKRLEILPSQVQSISWLVWRDA